MDVLITGVNVAWRGVFRLCEAYVVLKCPCVTAQRRSFDTQSFSQLKWEGVFTHIRTYHTGLVPRWTSPGDC